MVGTREFPFCFVFLKVLFPFCFLFLWLHLDGDVKFIREESWHPWSWHSVFWCGVSRTKVAISCSVAMHVPSRSRLKTVWVTKHQDIVFFYISTEDQLPCRTKHNKAFYVTKLFSLSFPGLSVLLLSSIVVTAQVPVELLCIKKIVFYYDLNCYSFCLPQHLILA